MVDAIVRILWLVLFDWFVSGIEEDIRNKVPDFRLQTIDCEVGIA
jgi:hypothetical protein